MVIPDLYYVKPIKASWRLQRYCRGVTAWAVNKCSYKRQLEGWIPFRNQAKKIGQNPSRQPPLEGSVRYKGEPVTEEERKPMTHLSSESPCSFSNWRVQTPFAYDWSNQPKSKLTATAEKLWVHKGSKLPKWLRTFTGFLSPLKHTCHHTAHAVLIIACWQFCRACLLHCMSWNFSMNVQDKRGDVSPNLVRIQQQSVISKYFIGHAHLHQSIKHCRFHEYLPSEHT